MNSILKFDTSNVTKLITEESLQHVINALNELVKMNILREALPTVVNYAKVKFVPEDYKTIVDLLNLDKDSIITDIQSLINFLEKVVEFGIADYFETGDMSIVGLDDLFKELIDTIADLRIINGKVTSICSELLKKYAEKVSISDEDLSKVDWQNEKQILCDTFSIALEILIDQNVTSIQDISILVTNLVDNLIPFINDKNLDSVIQILENISKSTIIEVALFPVLDGIVIPMLDNAGIGAYVSFDGYNITLFKEDLASLIDVIRHARHLGIVDLAMDYIDETRDEPIKLNASCEANKYCLSMIVDNVLSLNIINVNKAGIITFCENFFNIYLGDVNAEDINLKSVDDTDDVELITRLIDAVIEIINTETFPTLTIGNVMDGSVINEILEKVKDGTLLTNENANKLLNAVDSVLSTTLVEKLGLRIAFRYLPNILGSDYENLLNDDDIVYENVSADLRSIVSIVKETVDFGALDIYFRGEAINWGNTESVKSIVNTLFSLYILDAKKESIFELAEKMLNGKVEFVDFNISNIDFKADGSHLAEALEEIMSAVYVSNLGLNTLEDIKNFATILQTLDYNALVTEENANHIINALNEILELTILREAIPTGVEMAKGMIPESYKGIVNALDLGRESIMADLHSIVDLLQKAVDCHVTDYFEKGDLELTQTKELLESLVETIFNLRILGNDIPTIIEEAIKVFAKDINVEEIDLDSVSREEEVRLVKEAVEVLYKVLTDNNLTSVNEILDLVNNIQTRYTDLITEENATSVVELLEIVSKSLTLKAVAVVVVKAYAMPILEKMGYAEYVSLDDYTPEAFIEDLGSIISIVKHALHMGAVEVVKGFLTKDYDVVIDVAHTDINSRARQRLNAISNTEKYCLSEIVETLLSLNILTLNRKGLVSFIGKLTNVDVTSYDAELIDLKADARLISEAIDKLLAIIESPEVPTITLQNVMDMSIVNTLMGSVVDGTLLTNENVYKVLEALDLILDTTLVNNFGVEFGLTYASKVLPSYEELLSLKDITVAEVIEDLHNIVNVVRTAVDFGALDIYFRGEAINWDDTESVKSIVNTLFGLNILEAKSLRIYELAEKMLNGKVEFVDFDISNIDFKADGSHLAEALEEIMSAVYVSNLGLNTLEDIKNFATILQTLDYNALVTEENANHIINALNEILELTILREAIPTGVEMAKGMIPESYKGIVNALDLGRESIMADLHSIVDLLQEVVDFGVTRYFEEGDLEIENADQLVGKVLDRIFGLKMVDGKLAEITNEALKVFAPSLGINMSDLETIDWNNEKDIIKEIINNVYDIIVDANLGTVNEVINFVLNITKEYKVLITNENGERLYNIIELIASSQVVKYALVPVVIYVVLPMLDRMGFGKYITLDGYTAEDVEEDLVRITNIINHFMHLGAIDIVNGVVNGNHDIAIDVAHNCDDAPEKYCLSEIVKELLSLNLLTLNRKGLIQLVADMTKIDMEDVDAESIILQGTTGDAELMASAIDNILKVVESKEMPAITLESIMNMSIVNQLLTAITSYELLTEDNVNNALDAVDIIASTTLVEQFGIKFGLRFADKVTPDSYDFLFSENDVTTAELVVDLHTIVGVLRTAVELKALDFVKSNFKELPIMPEDHSRFAGMIESLVNLNYWHAKNADLINLVLGLMGIEKVDLSGIEWANESALLFDAVDHALAIVEFSGWTSLSDIMSMVNNGGYLSSTVLNSENALDVVSIIDNIVASEVIKRLAIPLLQKFVVPMVNGTIYEDLLSFEGYNENALNEDLGIIASILRTAVDFGAIDIALHDADINFEDVESVKFVIEELFRLNYLSSHLEGLSKLLTQFGINISKEELETVDFAHDGHELAEAYENLVIVLVLERIPFHSISDINTLMANLKIAALVDEDIIVSVSKALDNIANMTLLKAALPGVLEYVSKMLPDSMKFFATLGTSGADGLISDIHEIANIIREVVELGVIDVYNGETNISVLCADKINGIIDKLLSLNYLNEHLDDLVKFGGKQAGLDIDSSIINLEEEITVLEKFFCDVELLLSFNEIETVQDILDYISEQGYMNKSKWVDDNLAIITDVIDDILKSTIIKAAILPVYTKLVLPNLNVKPELKALLTLDEYTIDTLYEDLMDICSIVNELNNFGIIDIILNNGVIDFENTETITYVIETLFGLHYFEYKTLAIVNFLPTIYSKLEGIDSSIIDFAHDGELIANAYEIIAKNILVNNVLDCYRINDFMKITAKDFRKVLVDDYGYALTEALRELSQLTILEASVPVVLPIVKSMLPAKLQFLAETYSLTGKQIADDIYNLTYAIDKLIEVGVFTFIKEGNFSFDKVELLTEVVDTVLRTNYLDNRQNDLIEFALDMIGFDYKASTFGVDLTNIDWETEEDLIVSIVQNACAIVKASKIEDYSALLNCIRTAKFDMKNIATTENAIDVVEIVDALSQSRLVYELALPMLDKYLHNMMLPFTDFTTYNKVTFHEDLVSVKEILDYAVQFNIVEIIFNDAAIDWENDLPVQEIIKRVFNLHYAQDHLNAIIDYVEKLNVVDLSKLERNIIDLPHDGEVLADIYHKLAVVLSEDMIKLQRLSDILKAVNGRLVLSIDYTNDTAAQMLLDALRELSELTLFEAGVPVGVAYLEKVLDKTEYAFLARMDSLTTQDLINDYVLIIDQVKYLVDNGLLLLLENIGNADVTGLLAPAVDVLEALQNLNYLNAKADEAIKFGIGKLGLDETLIDYNAIDWKNEYNVVLDIVRIAVQIIENTNIKSYNEMLYELKHQGYVYNDMIFNADNFALVLDALEKLESSNLLNQLAMPLYKKYALPNMESLDAKLKELLTLDDSTYTPDKFNEDYREIVALMKHLNTGKVLYEVVEDLLNSVDLFINYPNQIEDVIKTVWGLNAFSDKHLTVVEYALGLLKVELTDAEKNGLDLDHDIEIVIDIVRQALNLLDNNKMNYVSNIETLVNDIKAKDYKKYLSDQNVLDIITMVETALDMTITEAALPHIWDKYVVAKVSEEYKELLVLDNAYTNADLLLDVRVALDALREVVPFNIVGIILNNDIIKWTNTLPVENAIRKLGSLQLIAKKKVVLNDIIDNTLSKLNVTVVEFNANNVDFANDIVILADVYKNVAPILADSASMFKTFDAIKNYKFNKNDFEFVLDEAYRSNVIEGLRVLLDTTFMYEMGSTIYYKVETSSPNAISYLFDFTKYTKQEINEDLHSLLNLVEVAYDYKLTNILFNKDVVITDAVMYEKILTNAWDLHLLNEQNKLELFNTLVQKYISSSIRTVNDGEINWDNELPLLIELAAHMTKVLEHNDLNTYFKLKDLIDNLSTINKRSYITNENAYLALDAGEVAINLDMVKAIAADVYNLAVNKYVPYESVKDVIRTNDTDYTKALFLLDLPGMIDLARKAVDFGIVTYYHEKDLVITKADEINDMLAIIYQLNMVKDREEQFVNVVFGKLAITVDLTGIDYTAEESVATDIVNKVIDALAYNNINKVSEVKDLVKQLRNSLKETAKSYRDKQNGYIVLDILTALESSELYMRSLLPIYHRFEHKVPASLAGKVDLTNYLETELREDYQIVLDIMKAALDGNLHTIYTQKREYDFPQYAVPYLKTVVASIGKLHVIDYIKDDAHQILSAIDFEAVKASRENDFLVLSELMDELQYIWTATGKLHRANIKVSMLGDKVLFENIETIMNDLINTTLGKELALYVYDTYLVDKIPARSMFDKIRNYDETEVYDMLVDLVKVYNIMVEMNVFGNDPLDFTNSAHAETLVAIAKKHLVLNSKLEKVVNKYEAKAPLMGMIPKDYSLITDEALEKATIKEVLRLAKAFINEYVNDFINGNYAIISTDKFESDIMNILHEMEKSAMIPQIAIPFVNGIVKVLLPDKYSDVTAIEMTSFEEAVDAVPSLFAIVDALDVLGVFDKDIKYKDAANMKALVNALENCPFTRGKEETVMMILLEKVLKVDTKDIDLSETDWSLEYQYIYNFLDKYGEAVNDPNIKINDLQTLKNEETIVKLADALAELKDSKVLEQLIIPLFNRFSHRVPEGYKDLVDLNRLTDDASSTKEEKAMSDYATILEIAKVFAASGYFDGEIDQLTVLEIVDLYDKVFSLNMVKGNEKAWFVKVSEKGLTFGDNPNYDHVTDWESEIAAVRESIVALTGFVGENTPINPKEIIDIISNSTNAEALEKEFTALNKSVLYRESLYNAIDDKINESSNNVFQPKDYLSDWFINQKGNMKPIAEWENEVRILARIIAVLNAREELNSFDLATISLGNPTGDASDLETVFVTDNAGVRDLLQLINASNSFMIEAIVEELIKDSIVDALNVPASKISSNNVSDWDAEIDALIALMNSAQTLELFNGNDAAETLSNASEHEITILIREFNNSEVLRGVLPDFIYDTMKAAQVENWASDWLVNQTGTGTVAPKAEWEAEAEKIAKVISKKNSMSITNLNSFDIADSTVVSPKELNELLHLLNDCNSFDANALVDVLESNLIRSDRVNSTKDLHHVVINSWDDEIDQITSLLEVIQTLEILNGENTVAEKINNQNEVELKQLLTAVNNSQLVRVLLPDLVFEAVKEGTLEHWASAWLVNQTSSDITKVETKDIWNGEIELYAEIFSKKRAIANVNFDDIELLNRAALSDQDVDNLEEVMIIMNQTNTFVMTHLGATLTNALESYGMESISVDNYPASKTAWEKEIINSFNVARAIRSIPDFALDATFDKANAEATGEVLDLMKETVMLGGETFNKIVVTFLGKTEICNIDKGFVTTEQLETEDWTTLTWKNELAALAAFDGSSTLLQTGEALDKALESYIFSKYFNVTKEINNQLENREIMIPVEGKKKLIELVNNGAGVTDADVENRTWVTELNALDKIVNATIDISGISISRTDLLYSDGRETLACGIYDNIISMLP